MSKENNNNCYGIKPCGKLAELLDNFKAPWEVQTQLAKAVGAVVPNNISIETVQRVLTENIDPRTGIPNWNEVLGILQEASNKVYKGKPPFPKKR